jgi:hypothetical protein
LQESDDVCSLHPRGFFDRPKNYKGSYLHLLLGAMIGRGWVAEIAPTAPAATPFVRSVVTWVVTKRGRERAEEGGDFL